MTNNTRGLSLVVVVAAMVLIGLLGWSLAVMVSSNFQTSQSTLESERAFYLADAGIREAMMLLSIGSPLFDNDTEVLNRSLDYGEYVVNRTMLQDNLTVISSGYVPSRASYRAMRQVKMLAVLRGVLNAIAGGEEFDWFDTTSITINGPVRSLNFYGPVNLTVPNEPQDLAIPGSGSRTVSNAPIPEIDMNYFRDNRGNANMAGDFTIDKSNANSIPEIFYRTGNITINTGTNSNQKVNLLHNTIVAEGNITITGIGKLAMKAYVNISSHLAHPNLATRDGNISSSAPGSGLASDRDFDGLIYSQNGVIDINCIQGVALMGRVVRLRGDVYLNAQNQSKKYVDLDNGFVYTGNATVVSWEEQ